MDINEMQIIEDIIKIKYYENKICESIEILEKNQTEMETLLAEIKKDKPLFKISLHDIFIDIIS